MRDSSVMMIPVEMAQTFPAAAMKNWWEEVNESAQWQDGIFFSLCGAYALVSAIALVKLMWIEISEPEDGWTKQTVFYLLNFVFHGVRAVLFRFHHEVFLEHPKVICWILLDLPVLLFFSAYTLVLLFLAETDQERDLPTDKLREIYIRGNVIVYFLQVNTWSYSWKKDASSVELVEKIFMAVVSFIVALGFLHYGRRLYSRLRGFPTESAERMKKRLEAVSVTAICFTSFLIKGIVVGVTAFDSDLRLDVLDRPVQNLIYYMLKILQELSLMDHPMESSTEENIVEESHKLVDSLDKLSVSAASSSSNFKKKPIIIIVVGMAGSGKTSFLHRLVCETFESKKRGYVLNLDPAVMSLPFGANIDIRDTVKYKEVMRQYNLGPNGGIMTSLNLFATKFDEVVNVIEKRADQLDYVFVDTPGQIEIFTWSASGAIITESFASTFPTVVTYVVDTPRSTSPITFMSNMLYACSILYKTRLPLVLAFNKTDVADHKFALEWMDDFEVFQAAIQSDNSYTSTLANSLSLSLYEFYRNIRSVGVSAISGAGMDDFFKAIEASATEYMETYKADLDKRKAEKEQLEEERREKEMEKLRKDMESSQGGTVVLNTGLKDKNAAEKMMVEDDDDDEDFKIEEDSDDAIDEDEEDEEMNRFYL
ncbi:unnamed protein product [Eruca vesicaria subsp. sativa]|uniref:THH1/TOM1/TOM3 domain-containing protein n=1 Tax=Eruca vesicaria subsp. sativa TaxID=29727 RepID=A0ABC8JZS9_ERUVS|nr:unnamed protein product [Eruca vesicaria subsp. sativa]